MFSKYKIILAFFVVNMLAACGGGDSGSPVWFQKNGDWIYIGATSATNGPHASLEANHPWWSDAFNLSVIGGTYYTAQAFQPLIVEAYKYLDAQIAREKISADLTKKAAADKVIAEDKAVAELKAKQEEEARTASELRVKQEADAKAAAQKKTTITCVKGKLTKKVTAIKPKCPAGYKKR